MEHKSRKMNNLIKNIFSLKTDKLLLNLLVVIIVPFILISFFNNPATDDFYLANLSMKYGLYDVHFWHYNNWSGRYFSNGILFFSPLYFDNFYFYKLIPIALLLLFVFAVKYFISTVFYSISNSKKWAISSLIIVLYFIQVPEVCSAFYWLPAAMTYQFGVTLTLLFISFYLKFKASNNYFYLLLSLLFVVFSMGCNEVVTILNSALIGSYFLYQLWSTKKIDLNLLIVVAIAAGFASLELFAPGNSTRNETIATEGKFNILNSLFKSIVHTVLLFLKWMPILLVFVLFYSKNIYKLMNENYLKFLNPKWAFLILFSILFLSLFPSFYIQNNIIADRALNSIYFYFIIFGLYTILCLMKFAKDKYNFKIQLNKSIKTALTLIVVFITFSDSPITNAYEDLINGKAYSYNNQMKNRFELIKNSTKKDVVVPALTKKPETIHKDIIMGLTNDLKNWKNQDISEYYSKSVVVEPSETEFTE